jgi:hypothetical protein
MRTVLHRVRFHTEAFDSPVTRPEGHEGEWLSMRERLATFAMCVAGVAQARKSLDPMLSKKTSRPV